MSDTFGTTPMDKEKQGIKVSIRLEVPLWDAARRLIRKRNSTMSKYLRGLIIADALDNGEQLS